MLSDLYMLPALFCIGPFPHDRSVGFFRIGGFGVWSTRSTLRLASPRGDWRQTRSSDVASDCITLEATVDANMFAKAVREIPTCLPVEAMNSVSSVDPGSRPKRSDRNSGCA